MLSVTSTVVWAHNVVGSPGPEHSIAAGGDERGRLLRGHRLEVLGALRALEKLLHILPACPKTCPNHLKTVAHNSSLTPTLRSTSRIAAMCPVRLHGPVLFWSEESKQRYIYENALHVKRKSCHCFVPEIPKGLLEPVQWCLVGCKVRAPGSCHPEGAPSGFGGGARGQAVQQKPQAACEAAAVLPAPLAAAPLLHRIVAPYGFGHMAYGVYSVVLRIRCFWLK